MPRHNWHPVPADDVPDNLILFDGVCVLCSGWVDFVIRRDPAARFRFTAIQTPYGRRLAERFGIDRDNPETNAAVMSGCVYFKSDSTLAVLIDLPGWRWTRIAYVLPKRVRDFFYDRIARNRYRLFGRRDSCRVPTPDTVGRFIGEEPSLDRHARA
jgi:predicted DCC family thiol-disulfide oxidoreductase YuxK